MNKYHISFVNYGKAKCGCEVEYSNGHGIYSSAIYVKLCKKHRHPKIKFEKER